MERRRPGKAKENIDLDGNQAAIGSYGSGQRASPRRVQDRPSTIGNPRPTVSYDRDEEEWKEVVVEDKHAGPAEVAATRIDFAAWLGILPTRLRRIAKVLATSESTKQVAKQFQISPGRVSQIRRELMECWDQFQGEGRGGLAVAYVELMGQWCEEHRVEVWACCLMPNHVHLIMVPQSEDGLRQGIASPERIRFRTKTIPVNGVAGLARGVSPTPQSIAFPAAPASLPPNGVRRPIRPAW